MYGQNTNVTLTLWVLILN